jgi:hypothetical protein
VKERLRSDDFPFFQDCLGVVDVPRPVIEMAPRPPWTALKPVARMRVLKVNGGRIQRGDPKEWVHGSGQIGGQ